MPFTGFLVLDAVIILSSTAHSQGTFIAPPAPKDFVLDNIQTTQRALIDDIPITNEPGMRSCMNQNQTCVCQLTGSWGVSNEYEMLKSLRVKADGVTDKVNSLDVHYIKHTVNELHVKLVQMKENIYTESVSLSVKGLYDIQKSVELMTHLISQLNLTATSDEVIKELVKELGSLAEVVNDLWTSQPSLDVSSLNQEIADLRSRLSNCRGNYNISYFRGDTLPVDLAYDGWCEDYDFVGVGDPVTHKFESHTNWLRGNFMKDPYPETEANRTMIYVRPYVNSGYTNAYLRFANYTEYIANRNADSVLNRITTGDGYTLYKGSIYDHTANKLNKYTVSTGGTTSIAFGPNPLMYLRQNAETYADMKADETGLYVIYVHTQTNGDLLIILKLDPNDLSAIKSWHTSRHKSSVCAAFMLCGKLHTIDNCWSRVPPANSHKQYVFDTTTGQESHIPLHIPSKFGQIRQLSYNSRERLIFGWDNGHMVTYPIVWQPKRSK